jgi:hypothetical protein
MFSLAELDDMLKNMLQAFHHYELYSDEMAGDEKTDYEQRHRVAWNTFQAMFGDRLANSSRMLTSGTEEYVLETLQLWVRDAGFEVFGGRSVLANLAKCSEKLVRLTSDPISPDERAIWPYVKRLR